MKIKEKKGFTLVELMIVVAIIGLLAAIAIPNFLNTRQAGATAGCQENVHTLNTASVLYQTANSGTVPTVAQCAPFTQTNTIPTCGRGGSYSIDGNGIVTCDH